MYKESGWGGEPQVPDGRGVSKRPPQDGNGRVILAGVMVWPVVVAAAHKNSMFIGTYRVLKLCTVQSISYKIQ